MKTREWNEGIRFLQTAEEGDYIEHNGRMVEVTEMCGGRFLLTEYKEVCGLVDEEWRAMQFLKDGTV